MYNDSYRASHEKSVKKSINYKRSISYKKSGLVIIISLLSLIALSTHTFAIKPPFGQRNPEEPSSCGLVRLNVKQNNMSLHEQLQEYTHHNCYYDLLGLLETGDARDEVKKCPHSLDQVPDEFKGYMGLHLNQASKKNSYPSTYWNTFDLLYAYSDLENQEYFSYIIGSPEIRAYFSATEMQYLAARFLSRENTVDKLIRGAQKPELPAHALEHTKYACAQLNFSLCSGLLNTLIPFGAPLTQLDLLQLIVLPYQKLTSWEQYTAVGHIKIKDESLHSDLMDFQEKFKYLHTNLAGKLFISAHEEAHEYLITELRRSAGKMPGTKGAIQVLEDFHKTAKADNGEAITSPFIVKYSVITMEILREALRRGLNPNTLMLGIDFNYSAIKKVLTQYKTLFDGPDRHQSLLEWAAMGNIEGAEAKDAVDLLLQAGANPHTLPESWDKVKQKWLKKWQTKVDSHDLPSPETRQKLSELMAFSPEIAVFMNNFQLYLDGIDAVAVN